MICWICLIVNKIWVNEFCTSMPSIFMSILNNVPTLFQHLACKNVPDELVYVAWTCFWPEAELQTSSRQWRLVWCQYGPLAITALCTGRGCGLELQGRPKLWLIWSSHLDKHKKKATIYWSLSAKQSCCFFVVFFFLINDTSKF